MGDEVVAYIGVGANLQPESHIPEALELLAREVVLTAVSTFYRSEPLGRPEQPVFLNGACRIETELKPRALKFDVLRQIEERLGRFRSDDRYAARTIDLDILLYGDLVCSEPDLRIPDPDIRTRGFVSVPLLELAPDAVLPDTGEKLASMCGAPSVLLWPDREFTQKLRMRLGHESGTR